MGLQHPIFTKYTRDWLHKVSGFSKGYLSRIATGKMPVSRSFTERVCFRLQQSRGELFAEPGRCLQPGGCSDSLGQWLEAKCQTEHLSLRQAAARIGVSHTNVEGIINGGHPAPETIKKLAETFADGPTQKLALEDRLLVLAGYRTERSGGELSESMAELMDKASKFSEPQLKMMRHFADFLVEIELESQVRLAGVELPTSKSSLS